MCLHRPKATHLQKSLSAHDSQLGADKRQVCISASLRSASVSQFDPTVLQVVNENVHIQVCISASLRSASVSQFDPTVLQVVNENVHIIAHGFQLGADKHRCVSLPVNSPLPSASLIPQYFRL